MKDILNRLIRINVELEGALRVAAERRSVEAFEHAKEKFAEFSALFAMINPVELEQEYETLSSETELKCLEAEGAETSPLEEPEFEQSEGEEELLHNIEFEENLGENIGVEKPVEEETIISEEEDMVEPDEFVEPEWEEDTPETEPEPEPESDLEITEEISEEQTEEPQKRETVDIRKLFTLNDKFLFRRELFNNSDGEFSDTLDLISSMKGFDEVEEYLYEDLRLEKENPTVKDFMKIVKAIFPK